MYSKETSEYKGTPSINKKSKELVKMPFMQRLTKDLAAKQRVAFESERVDRSKSKKKTSKNKYLNQNIYDVSGLDMRIQDQSLEMNPSSETDKVVIKAPNGQTLHKSISESKFDNRKQYLSNRPSTVLEGKATSRNR